MIRFFFFLFAGVFKSIYLKSNILFNMKRKTLYVLATTAIIGVGIVIINACSKSDSNLQMKKGHEYKEFVPSQEEVISLIKTFNAAYNNYRLGLKTGKDVPLNEALWNLEAGVNYEFCEPAEYLNNFSSDSTFVTVNVIDGSNGELLVPGDELMNAYTELLAFTNDQLNEGSGQDIFMLADIELKDVTGQEATFKMTSEKGHPSLPSCEIEDDDYWFFADSLGKCDIYSGPGIGQDASTRINYKLNCLSRSCNGTVFYTNIDTYYWVPSSPAASSNTCCDPQDMNFFIDEAWYTIDYYQPTGKVYIDCIYTYDVIQDDEWGHIFKELSYGVYNCKTLETK